MVAVENLPAIYAKLENRPGTLQRLGQALGERRINVDALSLETQGGQGFARIVVAKPREALDALRHAGIEAYESTLVVAMLVNKPNALAQAAAEIAAAGINVEAAVTTPDGRLAFRTSDNERAMQILRKL